MIKEGDLVVCVEPHIDGFLKRGHSYVVVKIRPYYDEAAGEVWVKSEGKESGGSYFQRRFMKINI